MNLRIACNLLITISYIVAYFEEENFEAFVDFAVFSKFSP